VSEQATARDQWNYEEATTRTVLLIEQLVDGLVSRDTILSALLAHRVRLTLNGAELGAPAAQELLLTATLLIARMGMPVEVRAPDAPLRAIGPPFVGTTLHEALGSIADELPGTVAVGSGPARAEAAIEVLLGRSSPQGGASLVLRAGAARARAEVAPAEQALLIDSDARVVALACAGVVAAQCFRSFTRALAPELASKSLSFDESVTLDLAEIFGVDPDRLGPVEFGEVDFISAGAITNAALYTLLRLPGATLHARTIEAKALDPPDLNRYMLALARDLDRPKVDPLAALATQTVQITGVSRLYDPTTRAGSFWPLSVRMRAIPPWVLTGVVSYCKTGSYVLSESRYNESDPIGRTRHGAE